MSMIENVKAKARADVKTIVFPEGSEARTVCAAAILKNEKLAVPILIGDPAEIQAAAAAQNADISGIRQVDPKTDGKTAAYAEELFKLRRAKGLTKEGADELVLDPMYFGIMMVKMGDADGLVSGAVHSTGDMLRPALQIIKTKPEMKLVSSSFLMDCPDKSLGEDGLLVYADCVVVPCPSAEELARIAIAAADTAKRLCGFEEPRVAMLSFSTMGSAKHALVDKVRDAVKIAHELAPDLLLDGEMQFDAALVPEIAAGKAKGSPVAGRANVLIFPDLQAGNIGYKITQRIGGADCFAVLQGLNKPCNDLSRGCSVEDIVNTAAMTAVQAQGM
ncbi:MAG: phosphate acetyltransferase [Lachnospiraceae bacterium]|nr:phosphate acetyltransferase [Lachnospiraceae bacterium]MBR6398020.1 phosphate acetyltransferase [Lachnospiraceae bacterium]